MNPNPFCRIEIMLRLGKLLIISSVRKLENMLGLLKIYSRTTMTPIVVRL